MKSLRRLLRRSLLALAAAALAIGATTAIFLTPPVVHSLLSVSDAHTVLGVEPRVAEALSDALVGDLLTDGAFDAPLGLALGIFCQLLVLPLLYAPIFFLTGTDKEALSRPADQLAEGTDGTFSWLLFALLAGILAPVVEELFYRGLLLKALEKRRMPVWAAVLVSSIIFAGMHMQTLQFPGLLLVGLVAGTLAAITGRLGPSIWLHIGFNMTTVVALFMAMRS